MADVEQAAVNLRRAWDLGLDSIENLTGLLEDKGIKVGIIEEDNDYDTCTFNAKNDGKIVVIITEIICREIDSDSVWHVS